MCGTEEGAVKSAIQTYDESSLQDRIKALEGKLADAEKQVEWEKQRAAYVLDSNKRLVALRIKDCQAWADRMQRANTDACNAEARIAALEGRIADQHKMLKGWRDNSKTIEDLLAQARSELRAEREAAEQLREDNRTLAEQSRQKDDVIAGLTEELESAESNLRETHARMLQQEPSTIWPMQRVVITMDFEHAMDTRIAPVIKATLAEVLESSFDGVHYRTRDGVDVYFNSMPQLRPDEVAEHTGIIALPATEDMKGKLAEPSDTTKIDTTWLNEMMKLWRDGQTAAVMIEVLSLLDTHARHMESLRDRIDTHDSHLNLHADRIDNCCRQLHAHKGKD